MVESIDITKVTTRDRVVIDLDVWMQDPDDHDFRPRARLDGESIQITNEDNPEDFATFDLDENSFEAAQRDRFVELRIKFAVKGMHGELVHIHPIIADGKAKKLAEPRWKTIVPLQ